MKNLAAWLIISLCCSFAPFGSSQPAVQTTAADVTDSDALYTFVVQNGIYDISSRQDFDHSISVTILDVTGDGRNDAVLYNDANWSEVILVITSDGDSFHVMKTDIKPAKYSNTFTMQDGFLVIKQSTGGTGVQMETLSLVRCHNEEIITVLQDLETALYLSQPDIQYEETSQIQGNLNDFEYSLKRVEGDTVTQLEHARYTYNPDTFSFDVAELAQTTKQDGAQ